MASYQDDPTGAPAGDARPVPARFGTFEVLGHLATGGMAEIYLARRSGSDELEASNAVVVKRLLPELTTSPTFVTMFRDEGRLVGQLDHPNINQLFEVGREGNEYFLVMEYLDGVNVHELIARPREPDRIAELRVAGAVIMQACAGLHYAHEKRDTDGTDLHIVHRDVSPSNLYVTASGIVKVIDFGVAKFRGAAQTEAGTIKGKTQYMAPEQLLGESLDRRADVFALGIVLFELATHQRLFKRDSEYLTARAILEEAIPRADVIDPAIPAAFADVIAKALARDKAARYATAAELAAAIETALTPHGGPATPAAVGAVVTASDELTAQRTRRMRIVDDARKAVAPPRAPISVRRSTVQDDPPTDLARTGVVRDLSEHAVPERRASAFWIGAVLLGLAFLAGAVALWRTVLVGPERREEPLPRPAVRDLSAVPAPPLEDTEPTVGPPGLPGNTPTLAVEPTPTPANTPPIAKKNGTVSIDSTPFATIYIDGRRADVTPLINRSVSAGKHKIRAVLSDGRAKELTVDVPAGHAAKPIALTW